MLPDSGGVVSGCDTVTVSLGLGAILLMTDSEKIDALADLLFTLIGDLGIGGCIPSSVRDILWQRVTEIKQGVANDKGRSAEDDRPAQEQVD